MNKLVWYNWIYKKIPQLDLLGNLYGAIGFTLELLRSAKKEWNDELKSSVKKREGANSQWWRDLAEASKKFWAFLTNIERPHAKKRTDFYRVLNEEREPTTSIEQTLEVQKKWCRRVSCTDWA